MIVEWSPEYPSLFPRPPEPPPPGETLSTPQTSRAKCGERLQTSANTAFACARTTLINAELFIRLHNLLTLANVLSAFCLETELLLF